MIELPAGLSFGEVVGGLGRYCVLRDGDQLTLCGDEVRAVTAAGWGPEDWPEVHRECLRVLAELVRCPVCDRWVGQVEGRVGSHDGCLGVNLKVQP